MLTGPNGHSDSAGADSVWLAALHDLRQPLQAALLLLAAAQDEADDGRRREVTRLAELSLLGLQTMLDELAFASRLIASGSSVPEGACRPDEVLSAAVSELAGQAGISRVSVRAVGSLAPVERRLALIVALALLGTALKTTASGSIVLGASIDASGVSFTIEHPQPDVQWTALAAATFVELPDVAVGGQSRLYTPGLGLARVIAEALGGRLECDRAADCHRISVWLPRS